MTDSLLALSDAAAGGIRILIYLFLVSRLLPTEKPGKKCIGAALAGRTVLSVVFIAAGLPELYRMTLEAGWCVFCAGRFQNAAPRMNLFLGIYYEIGVCFWQFLTAAWPGVLFHSPDFLDPKAGNGQAAVWLFHGLLVLLALYFSKRQSITEKAAFRYASMMAAAGIIAIVTLSAAAPEPAACGIEEHTLDMWTIQAVILMMSVLIFNVNRQYEIEKELAKLKSEQAELLERDYTALNRAYAVNAKLFHDLHNHIGVLRQLLSHKKSEEALHYLDELQAPVQEMTDTIWTGDETMDYLINSKTAAAKADRIPMEVQVEFPRHTNLRSSDLCAILGNLLDNALEAAGQVSEPEKRFVRLAIRRINQMLVIKVENSFLVPPVEEGSVLITTKKEKEMHGWGLKSARTAAEKYDGMIRTAYTDSTFQAVVTLSYQGAPATPQP